VRFSKCGKFTVNSRRDVQFALKILFPSRRRDKSFSFFINLAKSSSETVARRRSSFAGLDELRSTGIGSMATALCTWPKPVARPRLAGIDHDGEWDSFLMIGMWRDREFAGVSLERGMPRSQK